MGVIRSTGGRFTAYMAKRFHLDEGHGSEPVSL